MPRLDSHYLRKYALTTNLMESKSNIALKEFNLRFYLFKDKYRIWEVMFFIKKAFQLGGGEKWVELGTFE